MDAFIRNILEQLPISEIESILEEKRKMITPKELTEDDKIKAYLLKNILKHKNKTIIKN
ncbi:hypothetical protein N6B72_04890 [Chryseobacterium soli]|uniref:hypothetical protein n=1 Tax=Chryseobacterium soli TaxID=445961 RepID=UPI002955C676|nr:hypothetical protein [Chryseobacterium soli]MDV7696254.1 hypothetical protein [Chryseobacterium soli]